MQSPVAVRNYPVDGVFNALNDAGIEFVVLRGYEGLPYRYEHDLDICVLPYRVPSAVGVIRDYCARKGLRLFRMVRRPHVTALKFYASRDGRIYRLFIDLTDKPGFWFGCVYLSSEEVFAASRRYRNFRVPSEIHELLLKLFTHLLIGNYVREKHWGDVVRGFGTYRLEVAKFISERFPGVDAAAVVEAVARGCADRLIRLAPELRRALLAYAIRRQGLSVLGEVMRTIWAELAWYARGGGLVVCGPGWNGQKGEAIARRLVECLGHVWKGYVVLADDTAGRSNALLALRCWIQKHRDRLIICSLDQAEWLSSYGLRPVRVKSAAEGGDLEAICEILYGTLADRGTVGENGADA